MIYIERKKTIFSVYSLYMQENENKSISLHPIDALYIIVRPNFKIVKIFSFL